MTDRDPAAEQQSTLLNDVLTEDERFVIGLMSEDGMTAERLAGRLLARALHATPNE